MTASSVEPSRQAVSRLAALESLLDGHRRLALRRYSNHLRKYPDDETAKYESGCAQAIVLPLSVAEKSVGLLATDALDSANSARITLARAYIQLRQESGADIEEELRHSVEADPSFALAQLSLGRHLLWTKRETSEARTHLRMASNLVPTALGPKLDLMGLEAQSGDYRSSARLGFRLIRQHPLSARAWLGFLSAAILNSPFKGRLVILALVIALFFNYVGLFILAGWIAFAVLSLTALRRASSALAIYPSVVLAVLLLGYLARAILWGRLYP